MAVKTAAHLLENAVGWRAGPAAALSRLPRTLADPPLVQYAAADRPGGTSSSAGGAAATDGAARAAALGELLERTSAATAVLPVRDRAEATGRVLELREFCLHDHEQRRAAGFPYTKAYRDDMLTPVYSLRDNSPAWAPACLISGSAEYGGLATSSGLAADPTAIGALLRASQELVERDALMVTWLYGLRARRCAAPPEVARLADSVDGEIAVLDLTPAYSPHPVAMVIGSADLPGLPRRVAGVACRASWREAAHKAALEWCQAVIFAGSTAGAAGDPRPEPAAVTSFDDHARFYSLRPDLWARLPCFAGPESAPPVGSPAGDPATQLRELSAALHVAGVELFYRELSTPDAAACGVRVVRIISQALAPVHPDHRWPNLRIRRLGFKDRYPRLEPAVAFPSPYPHPLG